MLQQLFTQGFIAALHGAAWLAGAAAAVAVILLAAWLLVHTMGKLAAVAFDGATAALAWTWEKTGYKPKTRWGRVIAAGGQTGGKREEKRDFKQLP